MKIEKWLSYFAKSWHISDSRPQFVVGLMWELNGMLGIESKLLMVFHSQMDGQMERVNQELEQYLRMFIDYKQEQ